MDTLPASGLHGRIETPDDSSEGLLATTSDTPLAARIRAGDSQAECELARMMARPLFAAALRLTHHAETAEDLVSDTLLKLVAELRVAEPRPDPQLMAYALGVVRGLAANLSAKSQRQQTEANPIAIDQAAADDSPEQQAELGLLLRRLAGVVRSLPVARDRLLLTRLMHGVEEERIRDEFGWTRSQWEKASSRALQRLRLAAAEELTDCHGVFG
ncbi:MAG: hypothetical protein KDJ14_10620 [Xanthomonadales bacterium]|nr:hypothetical protein [Xanthomonadales bacterium]